MVEISLKSSDLLYLSCSLYEVMNPKAVVQIIPGVKEHKGRYIELINELNTAGFSVFISDIRGHGKSVNGNYPLGHIDDYQKLIEDQNIINDYLRNRYSGLPVYLLGDSLGAEIALGFIQKYDFKIQKLILCSPFKHDNSCNMWITTTRMILKFQKGVGVTNMLQGAWGNITLEKLVKDSTEKERTKTDVLCNFGYTNMAIGNVLLLNKDIQAIKNYQGTNKNLPIMILFGALDELTGGKKGINNLIGILNKAGYQNVGNLEYANMLHKILFETNKNMVYSDILKYLLSN